MVIALAREVERHAEDLVREAVAAARFADASWDKIAVALGVTRQGAIKRYKGSVGK